MFSHSCADWELTKLAVLLSAPSYQETAVSDGSVFFPA